MDSPSYLECEEFQTKFFSEFLFRFFFRNSF